MMPFAGVRLFEQSVEQEHVTFAYLLRSQMSLSGADLPQPAMAAIEHRIIMACVSAIVAIARCHRRKRSQLPVGIGRSFLADSGDRQRDGLAIDDRRRTSSVLGIEALAAEHDFQG